MPGFLLRLLITAFGLWVAKALLPGIGIEGTGGRPAAPPPLRASTRRLVLPLRLRRLSRGLSERRGGLCGAAGPRTPTTTASRSSRTRSTRRSATAACPGCANPTCAAYPHGRAVPELTRATHQRLAG